MSMAAGRRIILGSALAAPFIRNARAAPVKLRVSLRYNAKPWPHPAGVVIDLVPLCHDRALARSPTTLPNTRRQGHGKNIPPTSVALCGGCSQ